MTECFACRALEQRVGDKMVSDYEVREVLRQVKDPELELDIVSLGFIRKIRIEDQRRLTISLVMETSECTECNPELVAELTQNIKEKVQRAFGLREIYVEFLKEEE